MAKADVTVRPGGLTALSIINFVIAGITGMGILFSLISFGCAVTVGGVEQSDPLQVKLVGIVFNAIIAASLFVSGAGLIRINRRGALVASNLYAAAAVAKVIIQLAGAAGFRQSPTMITVFSLVYPVLLVIMVNIVFRDLWKNPTAVAELAAKNVKPSSTTIVPQFLLVFLQSLGQLWRSATGVLLTLAIMASGLGTAQLVFFPVELLGRQTGIISQLTGGDKEGTVRTLEQTAVPFIGRLLDRVTGSRDTGKGLNELMDQNPDSPAARWANYLVREQPGFLSFLFIIFITSLPPLFLFGVFNQISQDASTKGFRFILMRTGRGQIYFGKFLSSLATVFIMLLFLFASVILYMQLKLKLYDTGRVLEWGVRGFVNFFLLSVPITALGLLCSSLTNSTIGSLGISLAFVMVVPGFASLFARLWEPVRLLHFLLPMRASYFLFHPKQLVSLMGVIAMLGYGGLYLFLGFIHFKRRDL